MKKYTQLLTEISDMDEESVQLLEAQNPENKSTIDAVKKYFKDAYNFPSVRFKGLDKNPPTLSISTSGDTHTFNAKDLEHMLTVKQGDADSSNPQTYVRANYIEGTVGEWKKFIESLGKQ